MTASSRGRRSGAAPGTALPALRDGAVAASSGVAADAAHLALAASGSAVDAVVAGFFAAAGADASVLLGSAAAVAAGSGTSVRAFDGRPLQPGKGAPRPRGFVEGQKVPEAARVGVPRAVHMLMLLHAYAGRTSLSSLAKHGVEAALGMDMKVRARVLKRVGAAGPLGLRAEGVHEALLAAGNSVAGGALTEADLDSVLPADADARLLLSGDNETTICGWPWASEGATGAEVPWVVDVITAVDGRGGVAALAYSHDPKGMALPTVELSLPRVAVPVLRGVTRETPGAVLRAPGPVGVARFGRDLAFAFGLAGLCKGGETGLLRDLQVGALAALREGGSVEPALSELVTTHGAGRCVAAVRTPKTTRGAVVVAAA